MRKCTCITHRACQDANRTKWSVGVARRIDPSLRAFLCHTQARRPFRGLVECPRLRPLMPFPSYVARTCALSFICIVVCGAVGLSTQATSFNDLLVTVSLFCATIARTVSCCSSSVKRYCVDLWSPAPRDCSPCSSCWSNCWSRFLCT